MDDARDWSNRSWSDRDYSDRNRDFSSREADRYGPDDVYGNYDSRSGEGSRDRGWYQGSERHPNDQRWWTGSDDSYYNRQDQGYGGYDRSQSGGRARGRDDSRYGPDEGYSSSSSRSSGQGWGYQGSGPGYGGGSGPSGWNQGSRSSQRSQSRTGPKGYHRSDERLKEDVCEQLMRSGNIDVSEVSVNVQGGKVSLEGTVPDRWMKHAIEDVVDNCMGVKDIDNRVRVSQGRDSDQESSASSRDTSSSSRDSSMSSQTGSRTSSGSTSNAPGSSSSRNS